MRWARELPPNATAGVYETATRLLILKPGEHANIPLEKAILFRLAGEISYSGKESIYSVVKDDRQEIYEYFARLLTRELNGRDRVKNGELLNRILDEHLNKLLEEEPNAAKIVKKLAKVDPLNLLRRTKRSHTLEGLLLR